MVIDQFQLYLRSATEIMALSKHCVGCRAIASDGEVEVNAASILSLFLLNRTKPVTLMLKGDKVSVETVRQDIEDDFRLNRNIIQEEGEELEEPPEPCMQKRKYT